jgi:hypothetical protein
MARQPVTPVPKRMATPRLQATSDNRTAIAAAVRKATAALAAVRKATAALAAVTAEHAYQKGGPVLGMPSVVAVRARWGCATARRKDARMPGQYARRRQIAVRMRALVASAKRPRLRLHASQTGKLARSTRTVAIASVMQANARHRNSPANKQGTRAQPLASAVRASVRAESVRSRAAGEAVVVEAAAVAVRPANLTVRPVPRHRPAVRMLVRRASAVQGRKTVGQGNKTAGVAGSAYKMGLPVPIQTIAAAIAFVRRTSARLASRRTQLVLRLPSVAEIWNVTTGNAATLLRASRLDKPAPTPVTAAAIICAQIACAPRARAILPPAQIQTNAAEVASAEVVSAALA